VLSNTSRHRPARQPYLGLSPYSRSGVEFQRLRLQYTRLEASLPARTDDQFFLQWTIIMGSHATASATARRCDHETPPLVLLAIVALLPADPAPQEDPGRDDHPDLADMTGRSPVTSPT